MKAAKFKRFLDFVSTKTRREKTGQVMMRGGEARVEGGVWWFLVVVICFCWQ